MRSTAKPCRSSAPAILVRRREVPGDQRADRRCRAGPGPPAGPPMIAATLPWPPNSRDEAAAGPQRPRHARDHRVGIGAHPVQRGVREHRVELARERQCVRRPSRRASTPRARASRTMSGPASTPTTVAARARPAAAVSTPSPQPRSRMRSPGRGASSSTTGSPELGDEARHGWRSARPPSPGRRDGTLHLHDLRSYDIGTCTTVARSVAADATGSSPRCPWTRGRAAAAARCAGPASRRAGSTARFGAGHRGGAAGASSVPTSCSPTVSPGPVDAGGALAARGDGAPTDSVGPDRRRSRGRDVPVHAARSRSAATCPSCSPACARRGWSTSRCC